MRPGPVTDPELPDADSSPREQLLHLDASACEMDLFRDHRGLILETEPYVTGERNVERVPDLATVLLRLRDTQLPFCDYSWLVPEDQRPSGHELFADAVAELVEMYLDVAGQVRFTL